MMSAIGTIDKAPKSIFNVLAHRGLTFLRVPAAETIEAAQRIAATTAKTSPYI